MNELYKKLRPTTIDGIAGKGNAAARALLEKYQQDASQMPHALLLTGPSGCGKTTIARIAASQILKVGSSDLIELNCADFRGIDMVRDVADQMRKSPRAGKCRCWIIDECHQMTKPAQEGILKILEDTPSHVYFMLATTDAGGLIAAIKTRTTQIGVKPLSNAEVVRYLEAICKKIKASMETDVLEEIAEVSAGSLRKALVLLDQIRHLPEDEQLNMVQQSETKVQSISLARELLKPKPSWTTLAKIIKEADDEPETMRRMVLGYMSTVALSNPKLAPRAITVCEAFRDNYYDTGKAGLVLSCGAIVYG